MEITEGMVIDIISDGGASAIRAAKGHAAKIAAQMTAEINGNKSHTSSNTIAMSINVKIDAESRKMEIEGGFGFVIPNLGNKAPKIIREVEDPNQGKLPLQDGTTPNPDDTETEDA